ncbi:MAG TPA: hypothetical protein VIG25_00780 [Pyrinomonadaceae bacterium]
MICRTFDRALLTVSLIVLLAGCARTGNHERAYFTKAGSKYLIEMKADRRTLAHDPFSAIRGRTYEESLTIEVPRIEGVIQGSEIPVPAGKLRYTGTIAITRDKMKVDLYYDDSERHSLPWNGQYTLVPKERVP